MARYRRRPMAQQAVPHDAHEWVSFEDPDEERTWVFDVTFLTSNWTCIFGQGCQGVLTGPAPELVHGCCSYGAHFTDAADRRRVERIAATLTAEQWQFRSKAKKGGITKKNRSGETVTRIVESGGRSGPGAESSINKIWWSELDVELHSCAMDLLGPTAELEGPWSKGWQFSLAGPIYAGTNEIQRDIAAERLLGLPRSRR